MDRGDTTGAVTAKTGRADDLFAAASYSEFGRAAIRARTADPDLAILFDSTTSEPAEQLISVVREAFSAQISPRYVSVFADGNPFAVAALCKRYGFSADQVMTTTGATGAIALVLRALVGPGDEVLVEEPGFDIHPRMAAEFGAKVLSFRRPAPDFRLDLDDFASQLTDRTRVVLITNLHNPSGVYLTPAEIAAAAEAAASVGAVLVVDEVYADYAVDAGDPPAASLGRNVITVSSLTKVFGLFAVKFGWLAAAPDLVARIRAAAPDGDMGVSKLSHAVAAHVLEAPQVFEDHWKRVLASTRAPVVAAAEKLIAAGLIEGEVPPYGCMYFPRIVGVDDTLALGRRLFEDHGVLVVPGEFFGAPGYIRIGFGADPQMIETGLARLAAGLSAPR